MQSRYLNLFSLLVISFLYPIDQAKPQSTGSLKLSFVDNGGVTDTVVFGELHNATVGLDVNLGEFELPPIPPSGAFDVRWITPGVEGLSIDYRDTVNAQSKKNVWTLQFQPGSSGYPVTVKWDSSKLWSGFFQLYDGVTGGTKINIDMKNVGSVIINDNTVKSLVIAHTFTVNRDISLQKGWNLVSVPVGLKSWNTGQIFPGYISAYSYDGGYQSANTISHGKGYWVNFPNSGTTNLTGEPFASDTFAVAAGWNLIGSTFSSVSTSSIQQVPNSIVASYFFSYSNGYKMTTTVAPGQGIWVKSNQAGVLIFSSSSLSKSSQQPPLIDLAKWNTIKLIDANGASGDLYFSGEARDVNLFEMPPKPPAGVFDVRFSDDRFAGVLSDTSSALNINLQVSEGPLKIEWNVKDDGAYVLNGISSVPLRLEGYGSITLTKFNTSGELRTAAQGGFTALPSRFELEQNYPNPFNPATVINYQVPVRTRVTIKIYDELGREISTLVDEVKDPGRYQVKFYASSLTGGVYFCRLSAGSFVKTNKLVVIK